MPGRCHGWLWTDVYCSDRDGINMNPSLSVAGGKAVKVADYGTQLESYDDHALGVTRPAPILRYWHNL